DLVALITVFTSASEVTVDPTASTTVGPADVAFGVAFVGNGDVGSDIVLVKDQAVREDNGLYWVNTGGVMHRCNEPLPQGRLVVVSDGKLNAFSRFGLANLAPIV